MRPNCARFGLFHRNYFSLSRMFRIDFANLFVLLFLVHCLVPCFFGAILVFR